MHKCSAPVIQTIDTYLETLPRKYYQAEGWMNLQELPYWANENELDEATEHLERVVRNYRPSVCTAYILPMFINSVTKKRYDN
mgnify:FL=1